MRAKVWIAGGIAGTPDGQVDALGFVTLTASLLSRGYAGLDTPFLDGWKGY
jgi:hypothetical protein